MKTLRLFTLGLALIGLAHAQTQNIQQDIPTKRVKSDITIGNGRALTIESGATVTVNSGATLNGIGGDVSSNTASSVVGEIAIFSATTGKQIGRFTGTGVLTAVSGVGITTVAPGFEQALLTEIASPSTPSSGVSSLYVKADGTLYGKDDAGTERAYAGGMANRLAKTGAYTVVAADRGSVVDCTSGTFTVSLTASATLGAGFSIVVYNSGSGTITVDPAGSETIRDPSGSATSKTLAQGAGYILLCDGSGWLVVANASTTGSTTGNVTFSGNTITGTTSGNTTLTTSVSNADVAITPNGSGHVVINPRVVIEGISSSTYGLYLRGDVGSGNPIFIAGDTSNQARGVNYGARIGFVDDGSYGDHIVFQTKTTGGASTTLVEAARITSGSSGGGNLLVGTTSASGLTGSGNIKALGIDATPIGASSPSSGAFTSLANSGTHILQGSNPYTSYVNTASSNKTWNVGITAGSQYRISESGVGDRVIVSAGGAVSVTTDSGGSSFTSSGTGSTTQLGFVNGNGTVGTIVTNGSATAFNTSSDRRLKTNIRDFKSAAPIIDRIKPRIYDWKTGERNTVGFVAQELYDVYPAAVTRGDDNPVKIERQWAVDYSKLVPVLVAEIQALRARVAALEAAKGRP